MMWTCSEAVHWRSTSLSPLRQPGAPVQPLRGHRCHVCCGMPADSARAPPSATQPSLSLHRTQRRRDAPRRGRRRKHHHQAAPVRSCRRLLPLSPAGSQRVGGDWGRPGAPQRTHRTCRMLARMDLPSPQTLWACVRGKSALLNLFSGFPLRMRSASSNAAAVSIEFDGAGRGKQARRLPHLDGLRVLAQLWILAVRQHQATCCRRASASRRWRDAQ